MERWLLGYIATLMATGNPAVSGEKQAFFLSSHKTLISFISISVVIFELLGIVLIIEGWIRVFYLAGAIVMHKSIGSLMNLPFLDYQVLCFLLIDWSWVYHHMNKRVRNQLDRILKKNQEMIHPI